MTRRGIGWLVPLLAGMLLAGCGGPAIRWEPQPQAAQPPAATSGHGVGQRAVAEARRLVGDPYRYGGASPAGFDCSGLVYFAYRKAGLRVPRTTRALYHDARPVAIGRLRPGDLLFFRFGDTVQHVALYTGHGRFIHAPSTGESVSWGSLRDPFWRQRLVGAGRPY